MRLVWTSDLHLNHADLSAWDAWMDQVVHSAGDALVITGDVSEADDVIFQLQRIAESFRAAIYFVLGNHDFYGSSIAATRQRVSSVARDVLTLCYLTDSSAVELDPGCFLIGEDGWGDGTEGDVDHSPVHLSDFVAIKDFDHAERSSWKQMIRDQGSDSAIRLREKLAAIPASARRVIIATHVPPFRESCWYEGETTDDDWAPYFVCGQVGQVIKRFALDNPQILTTVLCGHTHHRGTAEMLPNLVVHTAAAHYGAPAVERVIEI